MPPTPSALHHLGGRLRAAEQELRDVRRGLLRALSADGWSGAAHDGLLAAGESVSARLRALADRFATTAERAHWLAGRCPSAPAVPAPPAPPAPAEPAPPGRPWAVEP
ncbi:MAG: hypothetical protein ACJ74O_06400 [Frankiaceae bacterium]